MVGVTPKPSALFVPEITVKPADFANLPVLSLNLVAIPLFKSGPTF